DRLGEYTTSREQASLARDAYMDLLRVLNDGPNGRACDANISIKLSALGQKIDQAFCRTNLLQLLEVASEHDVFVRLDMEGSDVTASTLDIFETVYPDFPDHVGPVL